jgi:hypothetical protein
MLAEEFVYWLKSFVSQNQLTTESWQILTKKLDTIEMVSGIKPESDLQLKFPWFDSLADAPVQNIPG